MSSIVEDGVLNNRLLPRIMLIACGSFSPPTLMHFRMFEIARDYFEMQGTHQVIGGIVSPTHDAYGKKGLAPSKHRCEMIKLALHSSSWIRLSEWETQQSEWSRTLKVLQYHQNYLNNFMNSGDNNQNGDATTCQWLPVNVRRRKDPIQIKLLCGADLLESFAVPGLWAEEDIADILGNHGLVVISRSGANPERFIFDSDILTKHQRNVALVTNWVSNDVSSSMIRRLLGRGLSVKYLIEDLVLEYIKKHGLFNYRTKYITDERMGNESHRKQQIGELFNNAYIQNQLIVAKNLNNTSVEINANHVTIDNYDGNEDKEDNNEAEERMDETDFSMKHILNSFHLNNSQSRSTVFCCKDEDGQAATTTKLLLNRGATPGQAVQIITTERGTTKFVREGDELKPKKMKITAAQNV